MKDYKEAIEVIQKFMGWFKPDSRIYKALKMAIKALSQEPTDTWSIKDVADTFKKHGLIGEQEPCEDAIDRAEAMTEIMMFAGNVKSDEEDIYIKVSDAVQLLRELPSVTQKSGKWILQPSNKEQGERDFIWWKCSECGQVIYSETEKDRREYHAFCGRCGAKMESEDKYV